MRRSWSASRGPSSGPVTWDRVVACVMGGSFRTPGAAPRAVCRRRPCGGRDEGHVAALIWTSRGDQCLGRGLLELGLRPGDLPLRLRAAALGTVDQVLVLQR